MNSKKCSIPGCKAYHSKNSPYCVGHNKREGNYIRKVKLEDYEVSQDPLFIQKYIIRTMKRVEAGKLDPKQGNTLNNMANTLLNIHDMVLTEQKIAALCEKVEQYRAESIEQGQLQDQDALMPGDEYEQ